MIAARIINPTSKLALSRGLLAQTLTNTIGESLSVSDADEDELYAAMDWLRSRQDAIEKALARRHLSERTMVLYDVTSTYFEGRLCPLARLGHSRDGRRDKAQIVFGLLTDSDGCPVAVEVFEGNTGDPKTLASQIEKIRAATERRKNKLRGSAAIGLRAGKVLGKYKVGKHFQLHITQTSFRYERNTASIEAEAALDGLYVIRTSLGPEITAEDTVLAYKQLAQIERGFRSLKTVDLKVRPIYHRLAERVRAHVLLCMLALYVEWHMRRALAAMLFDDDDKTAARAKRSSVVAKAQRSDRALRKAATKTTADGSSVHSFRTLLADLATIVKNTVQPTGRAPSFDMLTTPTPLQRRALDLLAVRL